MNFILRILELARQRRLSGEPTGDRITLSPEQSASFRAILENPAPPTDNLKAALRERKQGEK